jgi:transketolase
MTAFSFYKESMRETFGMTLVELGEKYKNLLVLDADLNTSTRTVLFKERFPHRFIQCGVAEGNMLGIAAGLASLGFITFPCTFAAFAIRKGLDQLFMNICYPRLNVKIPGSYSGLTASKNGPSHNMMEDIAIARSLPGLRVVCPGDNRELRSVMHAIVEYEGPVYFRVPRVIPPVLFSEGYQFSWGKGITLREGKDVTLMGTGITTSICLKAAMLLDSEGISAEVVHMPSIKPLDEEIVVKTAKKTGCIVTVEDGRIFGGFGSAISEITSREYPVFVEHVGIGDFVAESDDMSSLMKHYGITPEEVVKRVRLVLKRKRVLQ